MNSTTQQNKYEGAINRAIDYIRANIAKRILLKDIASAASISPFHFHRIFSLMMKETVHQFVKRVRIEKAASLLIGYPSLSITQVALRIGFSSSQVFARTFKEYYKKTPTQFRKEKDRWSKISNIEGKNYHLKSKKEQVTSYEIKYTSSRGRPEIIYKSKKMKSEVKVSKLPKTTVAYIRHIGPYKGDSELFGRLFGELSKWAGTKGLLNKDTAMYSIYYDDPDLTDESKAMVDVCISVPADTKVKGKIGKQTIPEGEYAIGKFKISKPEEYEKAWESIYKDWLPKSGYQPDDRPPFEMYRGEGMEKEEGKYEHSVEICLPVKAE